ncbi:MAG TPA: TetR/AcrR family transcriptional regulator C-terminal domain-containing protein [Candidatus Nanopelagicales bacterium]|nr:TetR/AcrR family transcriptional regulator C-terminal domain-containing protein [Candidatus Nanopelagicales bacterium]
MSEQRAGARRDRHRATHSMEAVLTEAVALLDAAGEQALTFRALAARLGGGQASIYWYVASRDELLDRASDFAVESVLATIRALPTTDDPIDDLRTIAVALFDGVVDRPWLAAYFLRNTSVQPSSLAIYEHLGQQTLRLDLTARQRFHAVSAITGYVIGTATDLGQEPPDAVVRGSVTRDAFLGQAADEWRALDPDEYPFVHHIVDEFAVHVDADQFRAGLDLLLNGLRLQARAGDERPSRRPRR